MTESVDRLGVDVSVSGFNSFQTNMKLVEGIIDRFSKQSVPNLVRSMEQINKMKLTGPSTGELSNSTAAIRANAKAATASAKDYSAGGAAAKRFGADSGAAAGTFRSAASSIQSSGASIRRSLETALGVSLAGLAGNLTRDIKGAISSGISAVGDAEATMTQFTTGIATTMLESGQAPDMSSALQQAIGPAKSLFEWTQKLAILSPFGQEDIANVTRYLQVAQFGAQETMSLTRIIADAGTGLGLSGDGTERLAKAFSDVQIKGKLAGQEVLQFTNAGVPALRIIAKAVGMTQEGLQGFLDDGGVIDSETAINAIAESLDSRFAGAAARSSETVRGLMNSLGDLRTVVSREFFTPIVDSLRPFVSQMVNLLQNQAILDWFGSLGDVVASKVQPAMQFVATTAGAVYAAFTTSGAAIQNVLSIIGPFAMTWLQTAAGIGAVAVAASVVAPILASLLSPIGLLITGITAFRVAWENDWGGIQAAVGSAISFISSSVSGISTFLANTLSSFVDWGSNIVNSLAEGIYAAVGSIVDALSYVGEIMTYWLEPGSPPKLLPDLTLWGTGAADAYLEGWGKADFDILNSLSASIKKAFEGIGEKVDTKEFANISNAVATAIGQMGDTGSFNAGDLFAGLDSAVDTFGKVSEEVMRMVTVQLNAAAAEKKLAEAQKELTAVTEAYDGKLKSVNAELAVLDKQLNAVDTSSQKEQLESIVNSQFATDKQKTIASIKLQKLAAEQRKSSLEEEKTASTTTLQARVTSLQAEYDKQKSMLEITQARYGVEFDMLTQINTIRDQVSRQAQKNDEDEKKKKDKLTEAILNYKLATTDTAGKIAIMRDELAKTTEGSVEYYDILTKIAGLEGQLAREQEAAAKKAKKGGALGPILSDFDLANEKLGKLPEMTTKISTAIEGFQTKFGAAFTNVQTSIGNVQTAWEGLGTAWEAGLNGTAVEGAMTTIQTAVLRVGTFVGAAMLAWQSFKTGLSGVVPAPGTTGIQLAFTNVGLWIKGALDKFDAAKIAFGNGFSGIAITGPDITPLEQFAQQMGTIVGTITSRAGEISTAIREAFQGQQILNPATGDMMQVGGGIGAAIQAAIDNIQPDMAVIGTTLQNSFTGLFAEGGALSGLTIANLQVTFAALTSNLSTKLTELFGEEGTIANLTIPNLKVQFAALTSNLGTKLTELFGEEGTIANLTVPNLKVQFATMTSNLSTKLTELFGEEGTIADLTIPNLKTTFATISSNLNTKLAELFGEEGSIADLTIPNLKATFGTLTTNISELLTGLFAADGPVGSINVGSMAVKFGEITSNLADLVLPAETAETIRTNIEATTKDLDGVTIRDIATSIGLLAGNVKKIAETSGFEGFVVFAGVLGGLVAGAAGIASAATAIGSLSAGLASISAITGLSLTLTGVGTAILGVSLAAGVAYLAWKNWDTIITTVKTSLDNAKTSFEGFTTGTALESLPNPFETIGPAWEAMSTSAGALVDSLVEFGLEVAKIVENSGLLQAFSESFGTLFNIGVAAAVGAVAGTMAILSGAMDILTGSIKALTDLMRGDYAGAWENFKGGFGDARETIMTAANDFLPLRNAIKAISEFIGGIPAKITELITKLGEAMPNPFSGLAGTVGSFTGAGGLLTAFSNAIGEVNKALATITLPNPFQAIQDGIQWILDNASKVPGLGVLSSGAAEEEKQAVPVTAKVEEIEVNLETDSNKTKLQEAGKLLGTQFIAGFSTLSEEQQSSLVTKLATLPAADLQKLYATGEVAGERFYTGFSTPTEAQIAQAKVLMGQLVSGMTQAATLTETDKTKSNALIDEIMLQWKTQAEISSPSELSRRDVGVPLGEGVVKGAVDGIKQALASIDVAGLFTGIFGGATDTSSTEGAGDSVAGMAQVISQQSEAIKTAFTNMWTAVSASTTTSTAEIVRLVTDMSDDVLTLVEDLSADVLDLVDGTVTDILALLDDLAAGATTAVSEMSASVKTTFSDMRVATKTAAQGMVTDIVNAFTVLKDKLVGAVRDALSAVRDQFSDDGNRDQLTAEIKGYFNAGVTEASDDVETYGEDIGGKLISGAASAIKASANVSALASALASAIQKAADSVSAKLKVRIVVDTSSGGGGGGGGTGTGPFAAGTNSFPGGPALVGEEGPELWWNKAKKLSGIVGAAGPEIVDHIPRGSTIVPATETAAILRRSSAAKPMISAADGFGSLGGSSLTDRLLQQMLTVLRRIAAGKTEVVDSNQADTPSNANDGGIQFKDAGNQRRVLTNADLRNFTDDADDMGTSVGDASLALAESTENLSGTIADLSLATSVFAKETDDSTTLVSTLGVVLANAANIARSLATAVSTTFKSIIESAKGAEVAGKALTAVTDSFPALADAMQKASGTIDDAASRLSALSINQQFVDGITDLSAVMSRPYDKQFVAVILATAEAVNRFDAGALNRIREFILAIGSVRSEPIVASTASPNNAIAAQVAAMESLYSSVTTIASKFTKSIMPSSETDLIAAKWVALSEALRRSTGSVAIALVDSSSAVAGWGVIIGLVTKRIDTAAANINKAIDLLNSTVFVTPEGWMKDLLSNTNESFMAIELQYARISTGVSEKTIVAASGMNQLLAAIGSFIFNLEIYASQVLAMLPEPEVVRAPRVDGKRSATEASAASTASTTQARIVAATEDSPLAVSIGDLSIAIGKLSTSVALIVGIAGSAQSSYVQPGQVVSSVQSVALRQIEATNATVAPVAARLTAPASTQPGGNTVITNNYSYNIYQTVTPDQVVRVDRTFAIFESKTRV